MSSNVLIWVAFSGWRANATVSSGLELTNAYSRMSARGPPWLSLSPHVPRRSQIHETRNKTMTNLNTATLADVRDQLSANTSLPERKRRDLISAVHRITTYLHRAAHSGVIRPGIPI